MPSPAAAAAANFAVDRRQIGKHRARVLDLVVIFALMREGFFDPPTE
jgi:hypothetical protein